VKYVIAAVLVVLIGASLDSLLSGHPAQSTWKRDPVCIGSFDMFDVITHASACCVNKKKA
jgi:hypothetical protein